MDNAPAASGKNPIRQIKQEILDTFVKPGFTFIEVLAPCPIGFGKSNNIDAGLDEMKLYQERCELANDGLRMEEYGIDFVI